MATFGAPPSSAEAATATALLSYFGLAAIIYQNNQSDGQEKAGVRSASAPNAPVPVVAFVSRSEHRLKGLTVRGEPSKIPEQARTQTGLRNRSRLPGLSARRDFLAEQSTTCLL
jgi:hypothetical protein